jgi:hypothetical protein
MQFPPERVESRREFFRAGARYGALAFVSALAALAARPPAGRDQQCVNSGICNGCGVFATCGLPQALSARRGRKEG